MTQNQAITRILWQSKVPTPMGELEVLIPLPTNADTCLEAVGINDFEDPEDEWYEQFIDIIHILMGEKETIMNASHKKTDKFLKKSKFNFSDIPFILSQIGDVLLELKSKEKSIYFTQGHEILWLKNIEKDAIEQLKFPLEKIENPELSRLFLYQ